jgi:hypothetical protein
MRGTNSIFSSFSTSVKVEIQNTKMGDTNVKIEKGGGGT